MTRIWVKELIAIGVTIGFVLPLSLSFGTLAPFGDMFDPYHGVWTVPGDAVLAEGEQVELADPMLAAPVEIVIDRYGIPHIYATTETDMAFALGYLHARDRLFQMDLNRRIGFGRLSEVLGADMVEVDIFMRQLGFGNLATESAADASGMEPEIALLDAEVRGINRFIDDAADRHLPLEFKLLGYEPERWTRADSLVYAKLMAYDLTWDTSDLDISIQLETLGEEAVNELYPTRHPYQVPIIPASTNTTALTSTRATTTPASPPRSRLAGEDGFGRSGIGGRGYDGATLDSIRGLVDRFERLDEKLAPFFGTLGWNCLHGSNNWVVDANRSATGAPIIANDPHLSLNLPSLWYEAHLVAAETGLNVHGVTFPGIPLVILGLNADIAWGFTNVGADVIDFYAETLDEAGERYRFRGEWHPLETREERIEVRGAPAETLTVQSTGHGPIMTLKDREVAVRWLALEETTEFHALYRLNRATNYRTFTEALTYYECPAQNFVYADSDGHIAMRSTGRFPIRNNTRGATVLDGASGDEEWIGWVPFEELPHAFDPPQHYLASANQIPYPADYDYYLGWRFANGYRARRINALLAADTAVTVDDMNAYQLDDYSVRAEAFLPHLLDAVTGASNDTVGDGKDGGAALSAQAAAARDDCALSAAARETIIDTLQQWDYHMDREHIAPAVFDRWLEELEKAVWDDEFERAGAESRYPATVVLEELVREQPDAHWFDDVRTDEYESFGSTAQLSFYRAIDGLVEECGTDIGKWEWGRVHQIAFSHLTEIEALGRGPYAMDGNWDTLNALRGGHGPSWRMIVDCADIENGARGVYPGGASGNPFSDFYDIDIERYRDGEYRPLIMTAQSGTFPSDERHASIVIEVGEAEGWW